MLQVKVRSSGVDPIKLFFFANKELFHILLLGHFNINDFFLCVTDTN
jgi:hypothetical protein